MFKSLFLSFVFFCVAASLTATSAYEYNPCVPLEVWQALEPYFLPVHHPLKAKLDHLFQHKRITETKSSFEQAGFGKVKIRQPGNIVVGKHADLIGYVLKVYLDTQPVVDEWKNWVKRIEGARSIRACLKRYDLRHFSVPRKWIYPLPLAPSPHAHQKYSKHFILIAEDMRILKQTENLDAFKNKISSKLLHDLYFILTTEGLLDSVFPDNIPFTKKGQIAFIDTEHHHLYPVPYHKLTRFLSPDKQVEWQALIESNLILDLLRN